MLSYPIQNIASIGKEIILFCRQKDGELSIIRDKTFFPYYFSPSPNGLFRGYLGGKFNKIICKEPYQIRDKRNIKVDGESDVVYNRRYLIDKIDIIKSNPKWIMFDIETKSRIIPNPLIAPDPITCITAYCNYDKIYHTFFLPDYKSEYEMMTAFIDYIKEQKADLLIAYNGELFDVPYLITRFPNFAEAISPINRSRKRDGYPEGISIVDYYKFIKKVYKYKRHSLDFIYSEEFKEPQDFTKYRFDEISDIIKKKNRHDVEKMVALENKLHLIDYFDEQRRIAKVLWDDLCNFSVSIDGLILQTAKAKGMVLPSKPDDEERLRRIEEDNIIGGYVYGITGRFEDISLFDVSGTYPSLITTFNLDPANKTIYSNAPGFVTIRKITIKQNSDAIVPTVANRLINSRKQIQKELEGKSGEEYELLKKQDEAHKSLNNTLYGILLFKNSRIYDKDTADTITYLARFLIRYTKYALRLNGYTVIKNDTDSFFVQSRDYEKIEKLCNEILIPRWLTHFGKLEGNLKFKYEGYFTELFCQADKRYKGNFVTAKGDKKTIDKGIELIRKDSSAYIEEFVEKLINKILDKEIEQNCVAWVKEKIENFKNEPLTKMGFPFHISQTEYNSPPIFIRALQYTGELLLNFSQDYHNETYWCYVLPFGKAERHSKQMRKSKESGKKELRESHTTVNKDVLAFDESEESQNKIREIGINWDRMIERNILMKAEHIFDAMRWNKELIGIMPKKERKTVVLKNNTDSIIKSQPTYTEKDFIEEDKDFFNQENKEDSPTPFYEE